VSTFYERAAGGLPEGHSSYFESPHRSLDPSLFLPSEQLHPDVRARLLTMLEDGLNTALNLIGIEHWLNAWLAGSGITYQWEGGEGDLDVLFGVQMAKFVHHNPLFTGIPEAAVAEWVNTKLKQVVWPATAHTRFRDRTYEVTFFWNPGTDDSIENIKPYAAYDLRRDAWVVRPPELPHDPRSLYPSEWYEAAGRDVDAAETIIRRHDNLTQQLASTSPTSANGRNAGAELVRVRQSARALFDEIHLGRRQAFGEQGHGYADWDNFRWQHAKATGVVPALRKLTEDAKAASEAQDTRLYGGPIDAADTIITREMMRYGRRP
jgi:hypothetical protein